ncbi:MAG: succinylglutamate desuccinylase/aspartoacylase family protein [Saprospiraceae bacterium]|nr:succinylglutamate desuccinylase/aspartoacylase family protein [Saprospiraceae bacterium]
MSILEKKWDKFSNNLPLVIDKNTVTPGEMVTIRINAGKIPSDNRINVHAHIFTSSEPGPVVLLLGGVHGDEINGIEIVRRSIEENHFENIRRGTLIVIPLLNVFGFINFSRDLSDGKDVNRSFPGHLNGSLASRIARILSKKILPLCDYAIDFHTGGGARYNFPHVRYHPADTVAMEMAKIFGTSCILEQPYLAHSFRKTARDMGVPAIVYEGGESQRIDHSAIQSGIAGIKNVLSHLGMYNFERQNNQPPVNIKKTTWVRAQMPGVFIHHHKAGEWVDKGMLLGAIKDPYGTKSKDVHAPYSGIILCHNNSSVVNLGEALFHIGYELSDSGSQDTVTGF